MNSLGSTLAFQPSPEKKSFRDCNNNPLESQVRSSLVEMGKTASPLKPTYQQVSSWRFAGLGSSIIHGKPNSEANIPTTSDAGGLRREETLMKKEAIMSHPMYSTNLEKNSTSITLGQSKNITSTNSLFQDHHRFSESKFQVDSLSPQKRFKGSNELNSQPS